MQAKNSPERRLDDAIPLLSIGMQIAWLPGAKYRGADLQLSLSLPVQPD